MGKLSEKSYLSMATWFMILVESKADLYKGDKISNYEILAELAKIFGDTEDIAFSGASAVQQTSKFRSGQSVAPEFMGFTSSQEVSKFDERIRTKYSDVLNKVESFVQSFLFIDRDNPWLIYALFGIALADEEIDDDDVLYVDHNGDEIQKKDLKTRKEVYVPAVVLGFWNYTLHRNEDRKRIKQLYAEWTIRGRNGEKNVDRNIFTWSHDKIEIITDGTNKAKSVLTENVDKPSREIAASVNKEIHPEYLLNAFVKRLRDLHGGKIQHYVDRVKEDYEECYTFRYRTKIKFSKFYVCSDICKKIISPISFYGYEAETRIVREEDRISNIKFNQFEDKCIAILGSGGYGKSMLMRHLLLSCIDTEKELVPIFIMLARFKADSENGLMDLIYDEVSTLGTNTAFDKITQDEIYALFAEGRVVLFLDGFDEIPKEHREKFVKALNQLTRQYNQSRYVISSRNNPYIDSIDGFTKYDILPLTDEQAKVMINKLQWASEELKKNIISDIETNRFKFNPSEKEKFLGNPLFLTIIVATYQYTHNIQTKRYLFYDDTYRVMYKEHDGVKGLTRPYDTKLDEDDFKLMFGEFCALAFSEGETKFEADVFADYFQQVIDANGLDVTPEDFANDITDKLCLMYLEGNIYHWIHRSFQEYLAAYFFVQQTDARFDVIVDTFIEREDDLHDDETLSMMYGLNPAKTEQNIIIPYLRRVVIGHYDEYDKDEKVYMNAYHDFIEEFYPKITFYTGDVENEPTYSNHPIYNFILDNYGMKVEITQSDFPDVDLDEYYADKKIYTCETGRFTANGYSIVESRDFEELSEKQQEEILEYGETEGVWYSGAEITLDFDYLFGKGRNVNEELIHCIDSPNFALRREFDAIIKFVQDLKKKYNKKARGSFLSRFH